MEPQDEADIERDESPELAQVACTGRTGPLPISVCGVALMFALGVAMLMYLAFLDQHPAGNALLVPLLVCSAGLVCSVWTLTLPIFDYYWKIGPDGILVKGLLKRRHIHWGEVNSVNTKWVRAWLAPCHVLCTKRGLVIIPTRNVALGASLALHLERLGKLGCLDRSPSALRTWYPALDALPDEVAWENQRRHELRNAHALFVMVSLVPAALTVWLILTRRFGEAIMVGFLALWLFSAPRLSPLVVWRATCGPQGLVVVAVVGLRLMAIAMPWQCVSEAEWLNDGLYLLGAHRSGVLIPWHREDRSSARLILSVLSRLRAVPQFGVVPIPAVVLEAAERI